MSRKWSTEISPPIPAHSGPAQEADDNRSAAASTVQPPPEPLGNSTTSRSRRDRLITRVASARSFVALRESTKPSGWRAATGRLSEAVAEKAKGRPGTRSNATKAASGESRPSQSARRALRVNLMPNSPTFGLVRKPRAIRGRKLRWDNTALPCPRVANGSFRRA